MKGQGAVGPVRGDRRSQEGDAGSSREVVKSTRMPSMFEGTAGKIGGWIGCWL